MNLGPTETFFIAGLFVANLTTIVGSYISMRISIAELKTLVGVLSKEVDELKHKTHMKIKEGVYL